MSEHLPILREMFPGRLVIGVDEIATLVNHSKKHIYNLSSEKRLKFKTLSDSKGKLAVSIVEMARYLDGGLTGNDSYAVQDDEPTASVNPLAGSVIVPKKRGRPRKIVQSKITLAFQSQLKVAIIKEEFNSSFSSFYEKIKHSIDKQKEKEEVNFSDVANDLLKSSFDFNAQMKEAFMSLMLSEKEEKPKLKRKKI